eukprot:13066850-Heterocapsa_arctica.AAC.1
MLAKQSLRCRIAGAMPPGAARYEAALAAALAARKAVVYQLWLDRHAPPAHTTPRDQMHSQPKAAT